MEKEIMEKMNRILDDMLEKMSRNKREMSDRIDEIINEPCTINIDKKPNGEACLHIEGNSLAILVALAGAEKNILKQLKCTPLNFEHIKSMIGIEEVKEGTENE